MRSGLCLAFVLAVSYLTGQTSAQGVFIPTGSETYHFVDRAEIKSGIISAQLHTSHKPYNRAQVAEFLESLDDSEVNWSPRDRFNLAYLSHDNFEWTSDSTAFSLFQLPFSFYNEKPFFLSYYDDDFGIYANPVLDMNAGTTNSLTGSKTLYTNTRGAEIRGHVNERIGFYTLVTENQTRLPYYVDDYAAHRFDSTQALPGVGYVKGFGVNGYDYLMARGYITFKATKSVSFQFGHDRNFTGNGIRSMILSDFAREYLFLKVNTQVWKLNYQNIFMELFNGNRFNATNNLIAKKYATHHHLSLNIAKNFNLGLSETIVFSRTDSTGGRGYDMNYLNPVIFYRSVEQNLNSADNAMVALDFKWNILKHISLYGQFLLDEFVLNELRDGDGWWGNKYGVQGGIKYIDAAGIANLDLQLEASLARPYTYTHNKISQNLSHYGQPLAHPLGANFSELIAQVRYQPLNRLSLRGLLSYSVQGLDTGAVNMGSDIFKNYSTRYREFGNHIGQGDKTTLIYAEFYLSYMLRHNLFLWTSATIRKASSLSRLHDADEKWVNLGIRLNFPQKQFLF